MPNGFFQNGGLNLMSGQGMPILNGILTNVRNGLDSINSTRMTMLSNRRTMVDDLVTKRQAGGFLSLFRKPEAPAAAPPPPGAPAQEVPPALGQQLPAEPGTRTLLGGAITLWG